VLEEAFVVGDGVGELWSWSEKQHDGVVL
jgi:hypothetical protein